MFEEDIRTALGAGFPERPAALRHKLAGHPLMALDRLITLARALPERSIEWNAGDLPVEQDPALTPMNGLAPDETLRRIAERRSWLVLKNVEQDTEYKALLETCLAELADAGRTGRMYKKEGFVFVSSPGAVTPFHMDPEHNVLLQVSGRKTLRIFPARDPNLVPPELHEAFHADGGHRNLPYREDFESRAKIFELTPGAAAYVPVKAPHWVKVGNEVSVSFSITWRSRASDDEARLHRANAWLRARGGKPSAPGRSPLRDAVKVCASRVAGRLPLGRARRP